MKKTILGLAALVLVATLAGCGIQNTNQQQTNKEPIKIGVIIPLTGNYASIGEKIKNGLELAKADMEKKNQNLKIALIYEDACMGPEAISATQKLINVDKVKIIGAQFCVPGLIASLEVTESNKVINVGIAASSNSVLNKNYYFSPNSSIKENSIVIADYAINNLKVKRAAFLYYDTQLGKDYRQEIGKKFESLGGQTVADEMTALSQTDFRANLTKIKAAKPDVIFMTQITSGLGIALKQAKEIGLDVKIVGNVSNEDSVMLSIAGKAAEGFIFPSADPALLGKDTSGFEDRFKAKYGVASDYFSSSAYDSLSLEISAYLKCQGDTNCIKTELHKTTNYAGASGEITINEEGIALKPVLFKVVKNGQFVPYQQ
jgi:branched-chain amino acid transport system substrate-binding protein